MPTINPIKSSQILAVFIILLMYTCACSNNDKEDESAVKIIFLHHSTGEVIWNGKPLSLVKKALSKISDNIKDAFPPKAKMLSQFSEYNKKTGKNYFITEQDFPKAKPYGWNNNPYDYYNIWVYNQGDDYYMEEPTLELLTQKYDVIIFKHCYPVCNIQPDKDTADINSYYKSLSNYKLQYLALREKMHDYPETKFIVFTGASQVKSNASLEEAQRAREFFNWVTAEWDLPDDNLFIWDLYNIETEGGLFLKEEYATSPNDPHPNKLLASKANKLLFDRIIDVIETNGQLTNLKGEIAQP
jgi:hypothetical protein